VIQHFTRSLKRVPDRDFRLPTDAELDALEAFMLSLGRQEEIRLPLPLRDGRARQGQSLFLSPTRGKCAACHFNAGANADPAIFGPGAGNLNFDTGVEDLPDLPGALTGELAPRDDGLGIPGDRTFNTPSLIESADTGPFFHNNAVETIEGAVAFYNGDAFNNSPAGQLLTQATGSGIRLDATEVVEVAAFLRVINALENLRESISLLEAAASASRRTHASMRVEARVAQIGAEIQDCIDVLRGGGLHAAAVVHLREAAMLTKEVCLANGPRSCAFARQAVDLLRKARAELVGEL
jgi:hypothetical protein